jgi:hypothetical protein
MNTKMTPLLLLCGLMASSVSFAGDTGAVVGGGVGGAVGAAIGHDMNGRNGAIIGAAIGGGQEQPLAQISHARSQKSSLEKIQWLEIKWFMCVMTIADTEKNTIANIMVGRKGMAIAIIIDLYV